MQSSVPAGWNSWGGWRVTDRLDRTISGRSTARIALYAAGLVSTVAVASAGVWLSSALGGLHHDLEALIKYQPGEATLIYASDGSLLARVAKENRVYTRLNAIPVSLRNATVEAEDRRFWAHRGVDFRGLGRALYRDIRTGRPAEGGSTLTMQLVRNIELTPQKSLKRKVREAALALELERIYSKPKLLEMYLNQVYYGSGAYGVAAAARVYFGRDLANLTSAQCALLATLPRRPTDFSPYRDPMGALHRRNALLKQMSVDGMLATSSLPGALAAPLGITDTAAGDRRAPYFVDAVLEQLNDEFGPAKVYSGGLRVYTTLNPVLQARAERELAEGVRRLHRQGATQGALVAIDPTTGEIKSLVGGVDYARSKFNRAVHAMRQPGSAFKPFLYAAAMDTGLSPVDKITDAPISLALDERTEWDPENHNHRYAGQTTLANAFAQSMNIPAVKLAMSVGVSSIADVAARCGIKSPMRLVPSLALGTSEVTPLEITSAYGVFATQGSWAPPRMIRKVKTADGLLLKDTSSSLPQGVLDNSSAQKVDYMLRGAVEGGTGRAASSIPNARGKTGTTQRDRDAWFVGYTAELVTGVWVGNDHPRPMHGIWGGTGCAPIWTRFMRAALGVVPHRKPLPTYHPPVPAPATTQVAQAFDAQGNGALANPQAHSAVPLMTPQSEPRIVYHGVVPETDSAPATRDEFGTEEITSEESPAPDARASGETFQPAGY